VFEQHETRDRIRIAMAKLPARERRIISLYYFGEATMRQIGEAIGVNESRVSQLHARAIQRLRAILAEPVKRTAPKIVSRTPRPRMPRPAVAKRAAAARRKLRRVA
jgi:RNA polymerase sigma factor for flagellar operon FliA